jgi:mannose-1-phosphate guanylyltransferase/mannose-6-phosphate isomerase
MPKPFHALIGETTLFDETLARCADDAQFAPPLVVAGKAHLPLIESQLPSGCGARIVVEPAAKSTAPAIALAAQLLPEDAVMLVCHSDHHIADVAAFRDAAARAAKLAEEGLLVAFGIEPTSPDTGFGYIKRGEEISGGYRIERFVEKPDLALAESFLADGGYCWNGGIFAFRAGIFLEELARHRPDMAAAVREAAAGVREDGARIYPDAVPFARIVAEAIDYAVMEETDRAAMVPAAMGWSDIGTWLSVRDALASRADDAGNVAHGPADLLDCTNVMVNSDGPRVSVVGLSDVIVVVDGDEILVTSAQGATRVGKLNGPSGG